MSFEVIESIGLLSFTVRAQVVDMSVELTHISCHVEWAVTAVAATRSKIADFILTMSSSGVKLR